MGKVDSAEGRPEIDFRIDPDLELLEMPPPEAYYMTKLSGDAPKRRRHQNDEHSNLRSNKNMQRNGRDERGARPSQAKPEKDP